jgi:predicted O-methyltransferase YrrM
MNEKQFRELVARGLKEDDRPQWLQDMVSRSYWIYYRVLAQLAKETNPKLIVELGTQAGTGALHFRHGAPKARIVTVDIRSTFPKFIELMDEHNIKRIKSDSVKAASLVNGAIDIIFFDANHEYTNLMAEVDAWMPKVKEKGIALFDDIHFDRETRSQAKAYASPHNKALAVGEETGMSRAWDEICNRGYGETFEMRKLHPSNSFGILLCK